MRDKVFRVIGAYKKVVTFGIMILYNHTDDELLGNRMGSVKAAFTSNQGKGILPAHSIVSFKNDLAAFTKSFLGGKTKQNVIDDFITTMKVQYGITVTIRQ